MSLYKHYELLELPNLYPNAEKKKLSSFLKIMVIVFMTQAVVYSFITLLFANVATFLGTLIATTLFAYLFVFIYMKNRIKKNEKDVY